MKLTRVQMHLGYPRLFDILPSTAFAPATMGPCPCFRIGAFCSSASFPVHQAVHQPSPAVSSAHGFLHQQAEPSCQDDQASSPRQSASVHSRLSGHMPGCAKNGGFALSTFPLPASAGHHASIPRRALLWRNQREKLLLQAA